MDMKQMMENAKQAQELFRQAYQDKLVTGKAGGELVVATANIQMQIHSITIHPSVLTEKIEVVQDLVRSAVNAALTQAQQMMQKGMMEIAQQMGMNK